MIIQFPEVRLNRELELRDEKYKKILPRASAIIVDSDLGKMNAAHRYGIDQDRIHIIPFNQLKPLGLK